MGHRGQDSPQYDSTSPQAQSQPEEDDEAEEDEAEELGHAETYADYVPSKCECPAMRPPAAQCLGPVLWPGVPISGVSEGPREP